MYASARGREAFIRIIRVEKRTAAGLKEGLEGIAGSAATTGDWRSRRDLTLPARSASKGIPRYARARKNYVTVKRRPMSAEPVPYLRLKLTTSP